MNVVIAIIVSVVIICLFILWWRQNAIKSTAFIRRIPKPISTVPLLGLALDFRSTKVILTNLMKYTETYGELVIGRLGPFRQFLLISDYKLLEFVLSSTKVITKSDDYDFLRPWLGNGLLTSDGDKWKKHRRVLTPAFHFQILEQFIEVFDSCGNTLVRKFYENLGKGSFDIYPYITLCTLDAICESIMGIKIDAQNGANLEYVKSVKEMCRIAMERSMSPIEMYDFLYPLSKNFYTQKKALDILHKQSNDVISARRIELLTNPKNTGNDPKEQEIYFKNKKPFLDLLLQSTVDGQPLTHEEIREQVDTFMFEGHDTTASALSFTLYCLANNPEAQRKAFEEQQEIFQENLHAPATYTDLQNMKYLELVIKESLRLYPSVPVYGRHVTEDIQYGDDVIPKGMTLAIFAFGIQRSKKYFKDPEKFIPERFEQPDGKMPYANIPFSAGPRNCIGQKFAVFEMKCVISKILRRFELFPAFPQHDLQLIAETILKSANGIPLNVQLRK